MRIGLRSRPCVAERVLLALVFLQRANCSDEDDWPRKSGVQFKLSGPLVFVCLLPILEGCM